MGLSYERKGHQDHGNQWTSYSDLFMGLSVVFLLLYVTSSLRQGTSGLQQQIEKERLTMQVQDLQQQLKVYNSLKKETIQSPDDERMYQNLLSKLDLLKEDAKTESERLKQEALENDQKNTALNQYQQLVRNMVNANIIAKGRIKHKEDVIVEKNEEIQEDQTQISDLSTAVKQKEYQIVQNEKQITQANQQLQEKMSELQNAVKHHKMTQKAYENQLRRAKEENQDQVESLRAQNRRREAELLQQKQQVAQQLNETQQNLNQTQSNLATTQSELAQRENQNRNLNGQLAKSKADADARVAALKGEFEAQKARDRAAFEGQLAKEKLSGEERAKRESRFRADADKKAKDLADKIAGLNGELGATKGQLAKALEQANARRKFAAEVKKGFAKAGVKAEVDPETGDVMLDFGEHYFDSGQARLKPEMVAILQKAFPVYAESIMDTAGVAEKVKSVEIVGYASPTYQGRVIDPNTLDPNDQSAIKYNMKLSQDRANAIFNELIDKGKMNYKYQQQLLPLMKASGKSFLDNSKNLRGIASMSTPEFCKKYDCKKAQRVIIKFGFDN